jgi:hypothetical protein
MHSKQYDCIILEPDMLRVPSPAFFSSFADLEGSTSDRTEIFKFTTGRAPKITRRMFEEKSFS